MTTSIDDQIKTLIDNPDAYENPSRTLGILCGKRAVAECKDNPNNINVWIPFNRDWEDLKTLLDEPSDMACINFREAETIRFVDAFKEGALEAVNGLKQIEEGCDDLDRTL